MWATPFLHARIGMGCGPTLWLIWEAPLLEKMSFSVVGESLTKRLFCDMVKNIMSSKELVERERKKLARRAEQWRNVME